MSMDDEGLVLRGPSTAEVQVPPDRYAVPASMVGPLARMTPVTMGGPGWWIIDELMIAHDEIVTHQGRECYEVLPSAEWGAALLRDSEQEGIPAGKTFVRVQYVPTEELWVYRDAPGSIKRVDEIDPFDPMAWYGRLMEDPSEPPPKRVPRPARELPSLTGRTVRWYGPKDEEWLWLKCLSEPLMSGADITVSACYPADYWKAVFRRPPEKPWVIQVPLHTVWAY